MSTRDSMPPDPLDHEERELAARLARIAPAASPSASLDARILAMAREAVPPVTSSRPVRVRRHARWLPAGLVTAMGTAAAFVVVVGVVWQLRPQSPQVRVHAGNEESAVVVAETVKRRQVLVAPAPPPAASAPAAAADMPAAVAQAQPRRAAKAATRPVASRSPAAAPAEVSAEINDEWQARDLASDASAVAEAAPAAAPPPPPPAAPAVPMAPAARAAGVAADARTGVRQTQTQAANSADLDRITVTGSRIALPPVSDDAALDPADWLQRIRVRRDSGELDAARASLARFRRSHPRIRIPDDLRSLQR